MRLRRFARRRRECRLGTTSITTTPGPGCSIENGSSCDAHTSASKAKTADTNPKTADTNPKATDTDSCTANTDTKTCNADPDPGDDAQAVNADAHTRFLA